MEAKSKVVKDDQKIAQDSRGFKVRIHPKIKIKLLSTHHWAHGKSVEVSSWVSQESSVSAFS